MAAANPEVTVPSSGCVATPEMCAFCFDVLISKLHGTTEPNAAAIGPFKDHEFPLFVTWKKDEKMEPKLRGCIGTFNAQPLAKGLKEYALRSALKDSRFSPITRDEVPNLHCGVSLLIGFQDGESYLDWEVGKHGIIIDFNAHGRSYSATYLPEVAEEQVCVLYLSQLK